ncbi:TIGR00366 family protein [Anoxybacter fermentans]|uniref:TIGR00366 family protein n=1 Tax=Anoxybacter fermentans TaxID=1323375 RepID=A0A3S9T2Q7_9FIRM|nr:TIGR00366 family protein [Anoxybacter fermentans]
MQKMSNFFVKLVQKYLPDPFIFAVLLTFIVFVMGLVFTDSGFMGMIQHWSDGFWKLLTFSMQMCLILITGHALASSPIVKKFLKKIADRCSSPGKAILITSVVALIASWIHWGFGLVTGALLAKEIAKKVKGVDYPLLIASAYIGFLVWHGGLSGSAPLAVATPNHVNEALIGIIPTSQTIFAPFNLIIVIVLIIIMPFVNRAMMPKKEDVIEIDPALLEEKSKIYQAAASEMTPAERLENSKIISYIIGGMGLIYIIYYFTTNGFSLNLNILNFTFLFVGILLHQTPIRYVKAVGEAVKGAGGIILQFPFYAGIMGMMVGSGLAAMISNWFVSISNKYTFPLFTFLSAGIINFFVPSGGGQWAVQAPIMLPAGIELGVPAAKTVMAVAWGDAWTNMVQPFWALPALGIAGLNAKDIMGYCVVAMLISGIFISLGLIFL